ncbi:MAG: SLC13 family permease [Planctomycetes bacterium]|jgi:di/tricarboxylate transporter|nr:SLC13 family permease [Planctomycetota bacterium]MBT5119648.1 SLC13 family permease [Planctomycetota bacterium]MBT7318768.1 SLC13 family permease [Planctomycetota bacterium]
MTFHAWASLIILVIAAVLFLTRWVRLEVVALSIPVALFLTGALDSASDALAGFGNHAVIAIASIFVLSAGIQESGVAALLSRLIHRFSGSSNFKKLAIICTTVAGLSAFMSNAATVAVFLPVVIALARRSKTSPSHLLMPLGFAAILGGNLTLIGTSSNLLVSDYIMQKTGEGLSMFDFGRIGLPICAAGILYLLTLGRGLLPRIDNKTAQQTAGPMLPEQLIQEYGLVGNIARMQIGSASSLLGQSLAEAGLGHDYQLTLVAVSRRAGLGHHWFMPDASFHFQLGDDLYLEGPEIEAWRLAEDTLSRMGLPGERQIEKVLDHGFAFAEVSIPPRSEIIGHSLCELDFRGKYGLNALSVWRDGKAITENFTELELQPADALLLAGPVASVRRIKGEEDFVLLTATNDARDFGKVFLAIGCLSVALLPPLLGIAPLAMSALLGAVLMILTKCLPIERAGLFMEWKVLAMIIGTIPLGIAIEQHGIADLVANNLVSVAPVLGVAGVFTGLYLLAALISITSSNAAAAVILSPIAARAALAMEMDITNALLAVAFGCSCAFVVPFAHQCNLMVAAPGGYRTQDFFRVGAGLSVVVAVVAIALLSLV